MTKYGLNELRKMYLDFFKSKEHLVMESFSLVPENDNSLLLINSGMAPLKPYFTGQLIPPKRRVTTCQKCIRTGDIENIGKTARHGTFFEMLGNFSFGDYFKREAIKWSWEFLTEVVGLDPNRLYPSVYVDDDEAFEIWNKEMGIPAERIYKFGKADNFWEHGAGPCGPCSEIYYDRGEKYGTDENNKEVGCEGDRFIEVWNNVFTQFENDGNGNYTTLKQKNIDTGMGLERLAVVVQDVDSIFDVDTIQAVIAKVSELCGIKYHEDLKADMSIRLITDHMRSATFMISDGILPSNEGRGYVLRRLIRRAARHGGILGIDGKFLSEVSKVVIETSKEAYPELTEREANILNTISTEEAQFAKTLNQGINMLSDIVKKYTELGEKCISGEEVFKLYDTYGFPLDIAKDYAADAGLEVDEKGFETCMSEQREKARAARAVSNYMGSEETVYDLIDTALTTEFVGYDNLEYKSTVKVITTENEIVDSISVGNKGTIFVEKTPFYATSGGQVADTGIIVTDNGKFKVDDVVKLRGNKFAHIGECVSGTISKNDIVELKVDVARRRKIEANHTATHLLHKALRNVLGEHIAQAGSLVDENKLRFDFTHNEPLSYEEIRKIENLVNADIRDLHDSEINLMPIAEAKSLGAMALFGEKYGDIVRVMKIGDSIELCGGTHVSNSGSIQGFKIVSETGVAAGVRRIEAVTGEMMFNYMEDKLNALNEISDLLKTNTANAIQKVAQLLDELKAEKRNVEKLRSEIAKSNLGDVECEIVAGKNVVLKRLDGVEVNDARQLCDSIKNKYSDVIILFAVVNNDKVALLAMVSDGYIKQGINAGKLISATSLYVGGKGGGRPNMAQGGGNDISGIDNAFEAARKYIMEI